MKYLILNLILFFSLLSTPNYAQWINSAPPNVDDIFSFSFINEDTGFGLGVSFHLYKTTNSGNNWNLICSLGYDVIDITFINDSVGFVCGDYGSIYKTTNGGFNWSTYNTMWGLYLYSLYFINNSTGFCAGDGRILKTTNAGENWTGTTLSQIFYSIQFVNNETGFAAGDRIYKTTNSGLKWNLLSNSPASLNSIYFVNPYIGFACASGGRIYKTTNSGDDWIMLTTNSIAYLFSIQFTSLDTGYSTGNNLVLKTTNSGNNWFMQNTNTYNYNNIVHMLNNTTGFVGGGSNGGYILKTTNGGGEPIGIESNFTQTPESFSLSQNYPNPFNPNTIINYQLSINNFVSLKVYDVIGNEIETLVNEHQTPGRYNVKFDGSKFSSGVYFYSLNANGVNIDTKKMLLIK